MYHAVRYSVRHHPTIDEITDVILVLNNQTEIVSGLVVL